MKFGTPDAAQEGARAGPGRGHEVVHLAGEVSQVLVQPGVLVEVPQVLCRGLEVEVIIVEEAGRGGSRRRVLTTVQVCDHGRPAGSVPPALHRPPQLLLRPPEAGEVQLEAADASVGRHPHRDGGTTLS